MDLFGSRIQPDDTVRLRHGSSAIDQPARLPNEMGLVLTGNDDETSLDLHQIPALPKARAEPRSGMISLEVAASECG